MSLPDPNQLYFQSWLSTLPPGEPQPHLTESFYFCNNQKDADELGRLVQNGIKTATCSLVWSYEAENSHFPQVGDISIVTNWIGQPLCIIQTTGVNQRTFEDVDAQHAYAEGEGDRSLTYWREVHWRIFSPECASIGRTPDPSMPLLCEQFRVIFP